MMLQDSAKPRLTEQLQSSFGDVFGDLVPKILLALAVLGVIMMQLLLRISGHPDIPGSAQLIRAGLFAMFMGDAVTFLASAQAYSDPLLALFTAFTLGCLFATSQFDERARAGETRGAVTLARPTTAGVIATS